MTMRDRLSLSPTNFRRVATFALVALALIVLSGSAVRLTGSGLGCPDWPACHGRALAPLETHAWIEYGNRLLSGLVALATIAAGLFAWARRPFRIELAVLGTLLPVGVVLQAALGALTVIYDLKPQFVMAHYILSMLLIDAAFALAWCSRYEPGERRRSTDRLGVWAVRGLLPFGSLTILLGTASTAAGPHAGASGTGEIIGRLNFKGDDTLSWIIERHGAAAIVLGLAIGVVLVLLHRRGGDRRARRPLVVALGLLAAQGAVGLTQYALKLPSELVWLHVALAVGLWITLLWSVAVAGQLEPAQARSRERLRAEPAVR
jgi:cytochrome c oxidase assembly protein subunit 15